MSNRLQRSSLACSFIIIAAGLPATAVSAEPPRYAVTIIGGFGEPDSTTRPRAINNEGHVVGYGFIPGGSVGFSYTDGLARLPSLLGSPASEARGLNDSGWIVGSANGPISDPFRHRAVLWANGAVTDLGTMGGTDAVAEAVNNHGRIVGAIALADGARRPFQWQSGSATPLQIPTGFENAAANDISDSNLVVGWAYPGNTPRGVRPVLWKDGAAQTLPILTESANTYAMKVNDAGHIIGQYQGDDTGSMLWRDGHVIDLGAFGRRVHYTLALDINNLDQVVGNSLDDSYGDIPFLWQDGVMHRLQDLLDPAFASIDLTIAEAINDRGQIAGSALINGLQTGVLLTPIPAPVSLAVLGLGSLPVARRRRGSPRSCVIGASAVIAAASATVSAQPPRYHVDILQSLSPPPPGVVGGVGIFEFAGPDAGVGAAYRGADIVPVRWTGTTPQQLPMPAGWRWGQAYDINKHGLIVGRIRDGSPTTQARAAAWRDGALTQLATPASHPYSRAWSVNDAGVIVGSMADDLDSVAVAWSDDSLIQLAPLPGHAGAVAISINNAGDIIGNSYDRSGFIRQRPVLWRDDVARELPLPAGVGEGYAFKINDRGDIIGQYNDPAPFLLTGSVIWHADGPPTYFAGRDLALSGLNNHGDAVGADNTLGDTAAVLYTNGSLYDLQDWLDPAGPRYDLITADMIADDGRIFATAWVDDQWAVVLLTPIPAPAVFTLLLTGLAITHHRRTARSR